MKAGRQTLKVMLVLIGGFGTGMKILNIDIQNLKEINEIKGRAICYSGFRAGQYPHGRYPTYSEVKEDLLLLHKHWKYLRLYDCDLHAETVLEVIKNEKLDFKVMASAYIDAEVNNFNCPWGGVYPEHQLEANKKNNQSRIEKLIEFSNQYKDYIFSVSVGNEACVDWTDHKVPQARVVEFVKQVKESVFQLVTFCESYATWLTELDDLANEVDFISIHTYPVWENKTIEDALEYTKQNYYAVSQKYPNKPVIITEAGWTTKSNGSGINPAHVNEEFQKIYFENLMDWVSNENILTFYFEAFDEIWKGSRDPLEPEKHWGLFDINRSSKLAVRELISSKMKHNQKLSNKSYINN
jgi:exo-beta-1,3-glucanase (GH17 family)